MEIQEIKLDALPSANFGPGVELLMSGRATKSAQEINLADISRLEQDLNDLSTTIASPDAAPPVSLNLSSPDSEVKRVNTSDAGVKFSPRFEVVQEPAEAPKEVSWDGFKSVNANTMAPEKPVAAAEMAPGEVMQNKFKYLRKLEELENKGVSLTRKYSMDSPLSEMQGEYENIVAERERLNSVKFQGKMLMACITGVEFLNGKFDPFDLKLDGWAEQVSENLEDYDDIFAELHEKYKSKAKMAPELKLMFQLGGSAIMLHMTNSMFKSAIPGMDDIMRQNPELMQKFTQAAVNSMAGSTPGFSSFMGGMQGPPRREPAPPRFEEVRPPKFEAPRFNEARTPRFEEARTPRPDMKGPSSNIDDLLSGLKPMAKPSPASEAGDDPGSTVSLTELNEMKASLSTPGKSKRRVRSDRNSVSIVI
jgi:hypothetical protein